MAGNCSTPVIDASHKIFASTDVLLHGLGTYLLVCLYRKGKQDSQHLYILSLGVCECLYNVLFLFEWALKNVVQDIETYLLILRNSCLLYVYYMTMIYITADKLFDIRLNITYHLYWDEDKTRKLLVMTWTLGGVFCACALLLHGCMDQLKTIFTYLNAIFDFGYLFLAFFTYLFIFRKYKETRVPPTMSTRSQHNTAPPQPKTLQVFKKSRFYIPVLIITSFIGKYLT